MTSACARTTDVLLAVRDDQLDGRTPCEKTWTLRELVAHVGGLAVGVRRRCAKGLRRTHRLASGRWRLPSWTTTGGREYPVNFAGLATRGGTPDAWEGMTRVGGVETWPGHRP